MIESRRRGRTGRLVGRRWWRRRSRLPVLIGCLVVAAVTALAGCTASAPEPGLFNRRPPASDFPAPGRPLQPTNPELPVAGEAIWTSSEGLGVTSRIAVHAVRRIPGATVLDWSVTPLSAEGLREGQVIGSTLDLGLGRTSGGDVNAALVDAAAARVYRPLQHRGRGQFNHCLCSPPWVAKLDLRIGETRLLQVAFPALPSGARLIDVSLSTVPVFSQIPVTPIGQVPTATAPTDLRRPADDLDPLAPPYPVRGGGQRGQRLQSIRIDAIEAGPRLTSMRWTLRSLGAATTGNVFPTGPPIMSPVPDGLLPVNPSTASGPRLVAGGRELAAAQTTYVASGRRYLDCLCTAFGLWAVDLRDAGGSASVTTVYPALPPRTTHVDVVLPGETTLWRLPVAEAFDGSARLGPPRTVRQRTVGADRWQYRTDDPPTGWTTANWPTPLPEPAQVSDYAAPVERLVPSS